MGLLTKAPTFRTKKVSKASRGEPLFPSLLLDTVSGSSLKVERGCNYYYYYYYYTRDIQPLIQSTGYEVHIFPNIFPNILKT